MRRLLCVWLPGWPTLRLRRELSKQTGASPKRPLATVETLRGLRRLAAVCPLAEAAGLRADMPLTQARAICPDLDVAEADPQADRAGLAALAGWAERYTPLAAADPPDGFLLDITGCGHLFVDPPKSPLPLLGGRGLGEGGGAAHARLPRGRNTPLTQPSPPIRMGGEGFSPDAEDQKLAADLLARLARQGIVAHAAIAGSAAAAWALARWQAGLTVAPPGGERAALQNLPIGLLRLETRCVAGLRRLGLRSIGELARLPRGEVSARFGAAPVQRLDEAFAVTAEPLLWPHPPAPWAERLAFAEPIGTPDDLSRALKLLAGRLCARLAAEVKGGHRFTATFLRVDGARPEISAATALPVRDPAYVTKLLAAKLETVDPGFGIDALSLQADGVDPLAAPQAALSGLAETPDFATPDLATMVDDLANRLGEARLWRAAPYPSHIPERSVRRAAPLATPALPGAAAWGDSPPRPLRLLRRPEVIDATAPVPDDPPILFRWRGCLHRVRAASGPERIAAEWWRRAPVAERAEADMVRDYYHVEDNAGARFWLFRTGRGVGAPGTRWFLHGLFG
jgi:protein ImuB